MGKSPLILAALANDAVPHAIIKQAKRLTSDQGGSIDSALLTADSGDRYVIRIGESNSAAMELASEAAVLGLLKKVELPFKTASVIGETRDEKGRRALVFDFVYGSNIDITRVSPTSSIAKSIGEAIAAIHSINPELLRTAGLPEYSPVETARARVAELDKAAATGKVPSVLLDRWFAALEDASLFRFLPTPVHSNLSSSTVLELDDSVSGVLGWYGFKLGDPAEDFAWVASETGAELLDGIRFAYLSTRNVLDPNLAQRATLYAELATARWLLHGVALGSEEIIDDATNLMAVYAQEVSEGVAPQLIAGAFVTSTAVSAFIDEPEEPEADNHIAFVDDRTREIELPEKSEDELF